MKEKERNTIIIGRKHNFFAYTMLFCGVFLGIMMISFIIIIKNINIKIGIPFLCSSIILLIIPFIVKIFDRLRPNDIISYDEDNNVLYIYTKGCDVTNPQEISATEIFDVKMKQHWGRRYYIGDSSWTSPGTITFILKDGSRIESLVIDDVEKSFKSIKGILIKE